MLEHLDIPRNISATGAGHVSRQSAGNLQYFVLNNSQLTINN